MFDQTFVESAPSKGPVLNGASWAIAFGFAAAGFLAGLFLIPAAGLQPALPAVFLAGMIAAFSFFTVLMLCYIVLDSRRLRLSRAAWFVAVLIFNLAGFSAYLIYAAAKTKNWKRAAVPLGTMVEALVVFALILYPLIHTSALPKAQLANFLVAPAPPSPPPPPAVQLRSVQRVTIAQLMAAPSVIPKTIERVNEQPALMSNALGTAVPGSVPNGIGSNLPGLLPSASSVPPPPSAPKAPSRIRLGGMVEAARIIYHPIPVYPPLAKMARIQGIVRLEAVIGKNGAIENLRVISGHPLLIQSALDAVRSWRYKPTLLDGAPVEVVTEIDVEFTLSD